MTSTIAPEITGVHPYADKFPMLPDAELDELAESIRTVGLLYPIIVTPEGLILDGRNRLEACNRAQVNVIADVYEGDDYAEYVIACNVTRRNMSTGARAMSTALVLFADGRRENGRWRRGSVDVGNTESRNTWQDALRQCGIVLDFKPDLADAVVAGDLALDAAFQQAKAIKDSAERDKIMAREKAKREKAEATAEAEYNAQIVADLTQAGSSYYLDQIENHGMNPRSAWAAYREDTRKERERAEQVRKATADKFRQIAKALTTASSWGRYDDPLIGMDDYDPDLIPGYAECFTTETITAAKRFIDALTTWEAK